MSRSTNACLKVLALLGFAGAILAGTPSCRDNNETIFVRQVQAPQAPTCIALPDPTGLAVTRGTLDAALSTHYFVYVLVGNQMVARGDFKQARSEPNRVILKGADVHLKDMTTGGEVGFYSVTVVGEVDPQTNGDATYGLAAFELIPHEVGVQIHNALLAAQQAGKATAQSYEARFKIYGTSLGGVDVQSGDFTFPVDVCYGCTVVYPSDAYDPTLDPKSVNCKKSGAAATTTTTGTIACLIGQDGITDCRNCQNNPVCTPCHTNADCTTAGTGSQCVASHCI